jgi:two-component system, NarL family, sensor histidine kinase DegS
VPRALRNKNPQLLPRFRSPKALHWAVVLTLAFALLVIYYAHGYSLPRSANSWWGWFWTVFFFEYRHEVLGLTLLVPILYAAVSLGWERTLVVMGVLVACVAPYILDFANRSTSVVTSLTLLILPPVLLMSAEIKRVASARERVIREDRGRERAAVRRQLLRAEEDERKRIAQELHDGVVQGLLVVATAAHNLMESRAREDASRADIEKIKQKCLDLAAEVRAICQNLQPSILDDLGLVSAIRWLVSEFQEETGVNVEFVVHGQADEPEADLNGALFRVVQEALSNVRRHSRASSVLVAVTFDDTVVTIDVDDDGMGFDTEGNLSLFAQSGKLGLLGMRDRAQAMGGRLQIRSGKGMGTCIRVSVDRRNQSDPTARLDEQDEPGVRERVWRLIGPRHG